ncbi:Pr6Pr family membrane protein [Planosporangium flavigriseum]|nr:Pr6Pr family membrane protein [Planosporangium flavigriseum]NJC65625.1 Pr6Pr family membrane protein [Planosporangium flavigriseum]
MSDRWARVWFGSTALVASAAVTLQLIMSASHAHGHFTSAGGRVINQLCYFTIESNVLIAVTTALLAIRLTRTSPVFGVFRVAGVVGIAITALVYHTVLAGLAHLTGWWVVTDALLHTVVPAMAILGWLLFGPRRAASWRLTALSLVYPVGYLVITLIRGALVGWYPYPFVDVDQLGYPGVLLNALMMAVLFIVVAAAVTGVDGWLYRRGGLPDRGPAADALDLRGAVGAEVPGGTAPSGARRRAPDGGSPIT